MLQATEARDIFLKYLAKSLLGESQSYIRFTAEDWAQLMNDMVERSVFGKTITNSVYMSGKEVLEILTEYFNEALLQLEAIKNKKRKE